MAFKQFIEKVYKETWCDIGMLELYIGFRITSKTSFFLFYLKNPFTAR